MGLTQTLTNFYNSQKKDFTSLNTTGKAVVGLAALVAAGITPAAGILKLGGLLVGFVIGDSVAPKIGQLTSKPA